MKAKNYFRNLINLLDGDNELQDVTFSKFMTMGLTAMACAFFISCIG